MFKVVFHGFVNPVVLAVPLVNPVAVVDEFPLLLNVMELILKSEPKFRKEPAEFFNVSAKATPFNAAALSFVTFTVYVT